MSEISTAVIEGAPGRRSDRAAKRQSKFLVLKQRWEVWHLSDTSRMNASGSWHGDSIHLCQTDLNQFSSEYAVPLKHDFFLKKVGEPAWILVGADAYNSMLKGKYGAMFLCKNVPLQYQSFNRGGELTVAEEKEVAR